MFGTAPVPLELELPRPALPEVPSALGRKPSSEQARVKVAPLASVTHQTACVVRISVLRRHWLKGQE
jgi:hypothetical protein